ncbi:MAG TPA: TonB-dependent receptor, partial [Thermoanaerobaculia bacterium]|nr:TonB-dependent receptor [Thermoanaerobaculia bacterium]
RAAVYGSFAAIVLLGSLARSARPLGLAGLSASGSVLFFVVTNFANWLQFATYPKTPVGLAICYAAAVPWFWNTLFADLLGTAVFFSVDAFASRRLARTASIAAVLLLAGAVSSPGEPQSSVSESVVVTATAAPQEQADLGAATTVITRDQIEKRGLRTVAEALRTVPGLDLVQSGDTGAITSVLLRGSNSNHTLLLIDGVRMNSPYFAGYDFSTLTTENVERIEIVRGPFSALYGSDAIGGVIQIFTRAPANGLSGRASLEAGNAGQREGEAFASVGSGIWGLSAALRDSRVGGDRVNSDWEQKSGTARIEARWGETLHAAFEAGLVDGEAGIPGPVGAETPHERSPWWEERLALPVSWKPSADHAVTFLLARVVSKPGFDDPDDDFFSSTRAQSTQARVGDTWTSGSNRLTGFASYERSSVDSGSNFGVDLNGQRTTIWGVGLEDTAKLPVGLTATGGVRYDRHSQFGSAWSPRATLAWLSPDSLWKMRASGGTAFRAPTVGELYFPFVGNPSLKAEHSVSYELGAERYLPSGRIEVSLFWSGFRDLIVYDFGLGQDTNVGRARTRGVETAWRQDLAPTLSLDVGYTYLDAKDRDTDLPLIRRPRHRAFVAASWKATESLTVSPRATFVGSRADNDALTGQRVEDPSHVRLDLFARYDLKPVAPYVRLENLGDRRYEEVDGYPAPRRRFAAGLEARF